MRQSVIGSTSRSSANPLWLIPSFWARYVSTCHCDRVSPEPRAFCSNLFLSNRATSCSTKSRVDEFASIDLLTSLRSHVSPRRISDVSVASAARNSPGRPGRCLAGWLLSVTKSNDAERLCLQGDARLLMTQRFQSAARRLEWMCEGQPAIPPVDTDGNEKQYKA